MPTTSSTHELSGEKLALQRQLGRMLGHFESMNARIALLAKGLDIPLETAAQVQAVLQCDSDCAAPHSNPRLARMREELRALLVMRYELFARMAKSDWVGAQAARDILLSANDRLLSKGFDTHDPGMNLRPFFDGIED